jgi:hypothetical protein
MQNHETIIKSTGLNKAEEYLVKLCEKTFLSLWGYANVYRKPGKELCDFLVIFGNHIIIFSDKNCQFTISEDIKVDWGKWFRRAVKEAANDVWGAERWIRKFPEKIFLDPKCEKRFPYSLPDVKEAKIHLVIVAHQISYYCKKLFGGSGSLMIRNDIKGLSQHLEPFTIGDIEPSKTFIHVFDDTALDILMRARDTIDDFTAYLQKKETLLRSKKDVFVAGEEELLAFYLKNINSNGEHDFVFSENPDHLAILEGQWDEFQKNTQHLAQIAADRISYVWDELIEQFNKHALTGTQEYVWPPSFSSSERVVRFLAAEPRFVRRLFAESFLEIIRSTPINQRMIRVIPPWKNGDPYFVFLVFPIRQDRSYKENRQVRINFLEACCRVVKLRYPDAVDIVGVATESGRMEREGGSEDSCYLDTRIWTEENEREAKELQSELAILVNPSPKPIHVREYPESTTTPSILFPKVGRNDKCPCGSGKKYKKCHGK